MSNIKTRKIIGFPGYIVSEDGKVFRNGKEVKSYDNGLGYRQVKLFKDGKRYTKQVHRLVLGEPNKDVDHLDRNKSNNSKSNLKAVSHSDNIKRIFNGNKY